MDKQYFANRIYELKLLQQLIGDSKALSEKLDKTRQEAINWFGYSGESIDEFLGV